MSLWEMSTEGLPMLQRSILILLSAAIALGFLILPVQATSSTTTLVSLNQAGTASGNGA